MELLLNTLWLLLTVPAFWLWRRSARDCGGHGLLARLRPVIVLGGLLLIMFPVISASDDMQAIRPAAEESSAVRRTASDASDDSATLAQAHLLAAVRQFSLPALEVSFEFRTEQSNSQPGRFSLPSDSGRAPPFARS